MQQPHSSSLPEEEDTLVLKGSLERADPRHQKNEEKSKRRHWTFAESLVRRTGKKEEESQVVILSFSRKLDFV